MISRGFEAKCLDSWSVIHKLTGSKDSYLVKSDDQYGVMKIYDLKDESKWKRYMKDLHYHKILSNAGVAPPLLFEETCENEGIIITEKYWGSLEELIESNQLNVELYDDLIDLITEKVQKMHDLNIAHGDLHAGNVVVNLDPLEVALIDYEYAFDIDTGKEDPKVQEWMQKGFDWEGTYDDFVRYDFENWRNI